MNTLDHTLDIIRVKKWVCYDFYFNVWQARIGPYGRPKVGYVREGSPCLFGDRDDHGMYCGYYLVSIEAETP